MRLFLLKMFREIYANFSINIDFFDLIIYYSNHFLSFLSFSVEIVNRPPSLIWQIIVIPRKIRFLFNKAYPRP